MKQFCALLLVIVFSLFGSFYGYAAESGTASKMERSLAEGAARTQEIQATAASIHEPEKDASGIEFIALVLLAAGSFLGSVVLFLRYRKMKTEEEK